MSDACKTPSPDEKPASKAASSQESPSDTTFRTITGEDWRRSIASARAQPNVVLQQIQTAISRRSPGTP